MKRARSTSIAALAAAGIVFAAPLALGQTIINPVVTGVTLKTFTPIDSLFVNPTASQFTITLKNTVNGLATEYRVSHFPDFHDASWSAYAAQPTLVIPRTWFPAIVRDQTQIMLYLQVRAKNPQGGRPTALINGKTTFQPQFFVSDSLARRIRIIFAG